MIIFLLVCVSCLFSLSSVWAHPSATEGACRTCSERLRASYVYHAEHAEREATRLEGRDPGYAWYLRHRAAKLRERLKNLEHKVCEATSGSDPH